jgi:hypothetical protein
MNPMTTTGNHGVNPMVDIVAWIPTPSVYSDLNYEQQGLGVTDKKYLKQLFEVAARGDSGDARVQLFRALDGEELFYLAEEVLVDGRQMLSTPVRKLEDGSSAMRVYSSKHHPDLAQGCVGAPWAHVLNVAYGGVQADWLVLINLDNLIVAIARDQIPVILSDLTGPKDGHPSSQPAATVDSLESAITNAVQTSSDEWYESTLHQLRGRELYLHLTDGFSATGQPSMRTSAAGGRDGWILTYTSRKRPGIKYGGIKWEELVKMVKNNEQMPGVRVVNNSDDWIILGRDVI